MYGKNAILSYLVIIFNCLLLMISIGYFGMVAKDKTNNIKLKTFRIVLGIGLLKLSVIILNFFSTKSVENIRYKLIIQILLIILTSLIYIIYIRVGQYLCDKNTLPGIATFNKNDFIESKPYIFFPLIFLILWNIIFFSLFNITSNKPLYEITSNDILSTIATLITICIIAPITEEIIYRHISMSIIFNYLGKNNFVIAVNILITSLMFSFTHIGIFKNDLLKIIQILPLGIVLAYLNFKKGLEYSIITHILFNTINFIVFFIIN